MSFREFKINELGPEDTDTVFKLVRELPPLTQHTWYTYWNLFSSFGNSCFLAKEAVNESPVGFLTSHPIATTPELEWFCWQFGILPDHRGSGLREQLQDRMVEAALGTGAVAIRETIEPDNIPSLKAFEHLAHRLGSELQTIGEVVTPSGSETVYRLPLL